MRMRIGLAMAALILSAGAAGAADAPSNADICKAAATSLPVDKPMAMSDFRTKVSGLGLTLTAKDSDELDNTCKVMGMLGNMAALPTVGLGSGIIALLQVGIHQGTCTATIISFDGCPKP